ncbi:MAG: M24 family metallopeptidase [Armatimonadetes bacterium]|nr:M24 family metallopeptidase [Armatimonadota bacterium]
MTRQEEITAKIERARAYMAARELDTLLLAGYGNFAWITAGGENHINAASETGIAAILLTHERALLLCDNIEAERLAAEQVADGPWERVVTLWYEGRFAGGLASIGGGRLAADIPLPGAESLGRDWLAVRAPLLPPEVERYRALGRDVGVAITHTCFHLRPGLSEHQAAGMLAGTLRDLGITAPVLLVAADERAALYRHPLPTARRIERYTMLIAGGRRQGLHVSITRLLHFGPPPDELRARHRAVARIDAAFLAATQPGTRVGDILACGIEAYAAAGFSDEWRRHHQGGPTGYAARDYRATTAADERVSEPQAFAWNPTLPGVKSEDTVLAWAQGVEVLSVTPDLPMERVEMGGRAFPRPGILKR